MDLSVVVPTLNARDELGDCLSALQRQVPGAEVIVVNGPSADGTTGMVQKRGDVDVLVEIADRTINVARNAGIERATGTNIALVNHTLRVTADWAEAMRSGLDRTAVVTGPTWAGGDVSGSEIKSERRQIAGRDVTYLNPGNAVFYREVLDSLDGFDEYLNVGGTRDIAHRIAATDYDVTWDESMAVRSELTADGGQQRTDRGWKYRSLAYRLVKNYYLRPTVFRRLCGHAGAEALEEFRSVVWGDGTPSNWLGTGRDVCLNTVRGIKDGFGARRQDRAPRRNPNGITQRADRAVAVYDWR